MLDIVVKDICFLVLFNFSGSGVVFGIILIFIVGDQLVKVIVDKDGKFIYVGEIKCCDCSDVQGQVVVDVEYDVILKKVLEMLK